LQGRNKEKIEYFYLPSYSPELKIKFRLKAGYRFKIAGKNKRKLRIVVDAHMTILGNNPKRIFLLQRTICKIGCLKLFNGRINKKGIIYLPMQK